ncbi:MAG: hypothetical protein AB7N76_17315 [Planctomycetota bacterium]
MTDPIRQDSALRFVDEAPAVESTAGQAEAPGASEVSDLAFVDASPTDGPEAAGDAAAADDPHEAAFQDVSPLAGEVAPLRAVVAPGQGPLPGAAPRPPAPRPPAARPPEVARSEEQTEVARRPQLRIEVPATGSKAAYAECPACQAKNPADARTCGRCRAEIPPPALGEGARGARSMFLGQAQPAPARAGIDPELIPEHVRAQFAANAAEQAQRVADRDAHRRAYLWRVRAITAAVFGFGVALFKVLGAPFFLLLPWALVDLALAFGLARYMFQGDVTRVQAAGLTCAACLLTSLLKIGTGVSALFGFLAAVWLGLVGYLVTFFVCMGIEHASLDQEI